MLKTIDFRNSVRSEEIQFNFDYLHERIKRDSLNVGGRGVLKGLEVTVEPNNTVRVSEGVFIDEDGLEVQYAGGTFRIAPIEPIAMTSERIAVNDQGEIHLPYRPYSSSKKGYMTTQHYGIIYPTEELVIRNVTNNSKIKALQISENVLIVDVDMWARRNVVVDYLYARNRLDTVLISKAGVKIATGIMSPSLTGTEDEHEGYFVLGYIETSIDDNERLIVHSTGRETRAVYVDENNTLFLNGKEYRGIFFDMPEHPVAGDIYIDINHGQIWAFQEGVDGLEWSLVNMIEYVPKREIKIYSPDEMPADMQTFVFEDDSRNMYYVPGQNQLEVIIDNVPLMRDQYEEIALDSLDINRGRGFKLVEPLDKAAYVEVRSTVAVVNAPLSKVYQRTSIFCKEGILYRDTGNTAQIFETSTSYAAGEYQLEVYVDGKRLVPSIEFIETNDQGMRVLSGQVSHFKILNAVATSQIITYRISRNIYTYDHIGDILESAVQTATDIANRADDTLRTMRSELDIALNDLRIERDYFNSKVDELEDQISDLEGELGRMDSFILKTDAILKQQMPAEVLAKIPNGPFNMYMDYTEIITLPGVKATDYITIHAIRNDYSKILIKDLEYSVVDSSNGAIVMIESDIVNPNATLYISGIKFGI